MKEAENLNSHTTPSSSPDFEFTVPSLPSSVTAADELFYKGHLLPLHISPRLRALIHSSSATTSDSSASSSRSSADAHSFSAIIDDPKFGRNRRQLEDLHSRSGSGTSVRAAIWKLLRKANPLKSHMERGESLTWKGARKEMILGSCGGFYNSVSGSLRRSCPPSPIRGGVFSRSGSSGYGICGAGSSLCADEMENAIQGAIVYCKSSNLDERSK